MLTLKHGIVASSLLFTLAAQADYAGCAGAPLGCGLAFTSVPSISNLTTANCTTPVTATYTVMNLEMVPTKLHIGLKIKDSLDVSATSIVPSDTNSCVDGGTLAHGQSCQVTVSFQPCTTGELDRVLKIKSNHRPKPLIATIDSVITLPPQAYVVNYGSNNVSICPISDVDGTLSTCTVTDAPGAELNGPASIAINPAGTFAYITNFGNFDGTTVSICPVNADGTLGSVDNPCTVADGFNQPNGLNFNSDGSILYIANGGNGGLNTISGCAVNADGSLGSCTSVDGGTNPNDIVLNADNSLAYVPDYYTDGTGAVNIYDVDAYGNLTLNSTDTAGGTLNGPIYMKLNSAGTLAYIANLGNNTMSYCAIQVDGTFDNTCHPATDAGGTLNGPGGFFITDSYAYISNNNDNTVAFCGVDAVDGSLTGCVTLTDSSFNVPNDVLIYP